jgi:hypothetical protein
MSLSSLFYDTLVQKLRVRMKCACSEELRVDMAVRERIDGEHSTLYNLHKTRLFPGQANGIPDTFTPF